MSTHPQQLDACRSDPGMLAHYASLLLGSFAAVGAIGWASSIAVQPLAALVVMSTCIALWAGFDDSGRLPQSSVGGLSIVAILIVGLSIHDTTLPDWLICGPWSTLGQAGSLTVFLLLNRRVAPSALQPVAKTGRSPETSWLSRRRTASLVGYAVAAAVFGYLVVLPVGEELLSRLSEPAHSSTIEDMTLAESIRLNAVRVFAAVWAFLIGACVGSFANVLVYRQPRGESVLMRPSACPACNHRIEARDNIPVFGWLRLGGTCRNCTAEISPRYPVVEAVAGTIFVLLVFVELTSGGANLPVRRTNGYTGFVWTVFYPKWDLIALTLYHFHLFVMLLTWSLMRLDRVRLPLRSVIPALLIAVAGPLIWTKLWLVPPGFIGTDYYPQSIGVVAVALAAAVAVALTLAVLGNLLRIDLFRNLAPPLALIGATLGWQALLVIVVATSLIQMILKALRRQFISIGWTLFAIALIHQVFWRAVSATVATFVGVHQQPFYR